MIEHDVYVASSGAVGVGADRRAVRGGNGLGDQESEADAVNSARALAGGEIENPGDPSDREPAATALRQKEQRRGRGDPAVKGFGFERTQPSPVSSPTDRARQSCGGAMHLHGDAGINSTGRALRARSTGLTVDADE